MFLRILFFFATWGKVCVSASCVSMVAPVFFSLLFKQWNNVEVLLFPIRVSL